MLEKTMKQILTKKINKWVASIDDADLQVLVKKNVVVTGGCFASMIQNEEPKDFDIYFRDIVTVYKVSKYYVKKFKDSHPDMKNIEVQLLYNDEWVHSEDFDQNNLSLSRVTRIRIFIQSAGVAKELEENNIANIETGEDPVEAMNNADEVPANTLDQKEPFRPVFLSSNAITLSDKLQLVVRFWGDPKKIHETYDFEHTKAYWTSNEKQVVIPARVYELVTNKRLIYTGSKYPLASIIRIRKFIQRGWNISAGEILKISMQLNTFNLSDINVLEDQLTGVDSSYFCMLIDALKKRKEGDPSFTIDHTYVASLVDRIF